MLKSLTLVLQLSINIANDEFGRGDCDEVEARILLVSSIFKKSTRVGFLTSSAKKALNFSQYTFT